MAGMSGKTSPRIAVMMGGFAAERDVSHRSGASCARALRTAGYHGTRVDHGHALLGAPVAKARVTLKRHRVKDVRTICSLAPLDCYGVVPSCSEIHNVVQLAVVADVRNATQPSRRNAQGVRYCAPATNAFGHTSLSPLIFGFNRIQCRADATCEGQEALDQRSVERQLHKRALLTKTADPVSLPRRKTSENIPCKR